MQPFPNGFERYLCPALFQERRPIMNLTLVRTAMPEPERNAESASAHCSTELLTLTDEELNTVNGAWYGPGYGYNYGSNCPYAFDPYYDYGYYGGCHRRHCYRYW
jgi:hypothetical protein